LLNRFLPFLSAESPIGFESKGDVMHPVHVEALKEQVKIIAAGCDFSLAVGESGKVYGWGKGLSDLSEETCTQPTQL
jgi:alpha-tubulin suppressor-like RCC1 family protein